MSNKKKSKKVFKVGVNLAALPGSDEERRFEAGDPIPKNLTPKETKALTALGAIGEDGEEAEDGE